MRKNIKFITLMLSLVFCLSAVAFGQETTGDIEGTVKDPNGGVVPSVSITVQSLGSDSTGFTRTVSTNEEGFFRVLQVPPGNFTVTAAATGGFGSSTIENVRVELGKTTPVNISVNAGGVAATVDIQAADTPQIDPTDNKLQTNIKTQEIESLPKGTNFTSLLKIAPAVREEPAAGGFQIDGASGAENTFIVDGQEVTNFRTGQLNGNNNLPFQLVQEVQVKSSGFEAEFGGATGGVINLTTKGGTNDFRGEFGISFEPSQFQGSFRPIQRVFSRGGVNMVENFNTDKGSGLGFFPTATLGGPILKNRLWFFGSYTPQYREETRNIDFSTSDPATRTITSSDTFRSRVTNEYAFGRLDANITSRLRLNASYTYNPIIQNGILPLRQDAFGGVPSATFDRGGGNLETLRGSAFQDQRGGRQNSNNSNVQGFYTPTSNIVLHARYGYSFLNEKLNSTGVPPVGPVRFLCSTASVGTIPAQFGCTVGQQSTVFTQNLLFDISTRKTFDVDGTVLFSMFGKNEVKGGYQRNALTNNRSLVSTDQVVLQFGRTIAQVSGRPLTSTTGAIGAGFLQRFAAQGSVGSNNQAFFIQDKFQPINRLTFNFGVRIEKEDIPSFNTFSGFGFDYGDKITPRFGVAYDLTGNGKTKVFFSYGRFFDRFKYELPRGSFGGEFFRRDYFEIFPNGGSFTSFTPARIRGTNPDPAVGGNCPSPAGIVGSTGLSRCQRDFRPSSNVPGDITEVGGIDPDIKPFQQTELTGGVEHQLTKNLIIGGRYTHKTVDRAVEDVGLINSNGSEVFIIGNPGLGLSSTIANGSRLTSVEAVRDYDALEVRLDKRFSNNYFFNASYTFSRLFGNYAGLATSDEFGRASPNVGRAFDSLAFGFTATGEQDLGRLATDRPHSFKAYGGYNFDFSQSNTTEISAFTTLQSGSPVTSRVDILGITTIPLNGRGDLGRTDMFKQTDLGIRHRYRFGRDNRFTLVGELDVLNLFDSDSELNRFESIDPGISFSEGDFGFATTQDFIRAFQTRSFRNEILADITQDARFNLPNAFQAGRNIRFGFRFLF
jgi:hypothetical protein